MSRYYLSFPLFWLVTAVCMLAFTVSRAQAAAPLLITQNVDETTLVTLAGNVRPEAQGKYDRGLVADSLPMEHMFLQLKRSPQQERELESYIDDIQDHASPNYHRWLTAKEFGARFGLAQQDLDTITRWLSSHGLTVNVVYDNGLLIDFSGTAGQVRSAFHTEIHHLNVNGAKHIANMTNPQIPTALTSAVQGIVSLHDFTPRPQYKLKSNYTFADGGNTYYAVVPSDLATIYNLNPLFTNGITGQRQTIAVLEDSDVYNAQDWSTFRSVFGLSSYTQGSFTQVHPEPSSGEQNCFDPRTNYNDGEAELDAEYASAAAPNAAIVVASCADTTTFGGLIAMQNLLNSSSAPPPVISISYGECEAENGAASNAAFNAAYQQAVMEGVSVFVSSGDDGPSSCSVDQYYSTYGIGVSGLASTPYNVAVGGTDFGDTYAGTNSTYWSQNNNNYYGSALSYVPEIPWNDSCASQLISEYEGYPLTYGDDSYCNNAPDASWTVVAGSGGPSGCATGTAAQPGIVGGTCKGYPKPQWQSLVGVPNDGFRDIPDISLFAANGFWGHYYVFCYTDPTAGYGGAPCTGTPDTWAGGGGTSFSAPIMAGIQALIDQTTGERQGNPNPIYYSLAANEYGASGNSSCNSTLGNTAGNSCTFYDVTLGDNNIDCGYGVNCYFPNYDPPDPLVGVLSTSTNSFEPAYVTTTGWDFSTGIGSVNAANLVNNWPEPVPNFSLVATPNALTIIVGNSAASTIAIIPQGGFNANVQFTVSGLPNGVTALFSPNPATSTTTLTLTASATATGGPATLTITGTSGQLTNSTTLSLDITEGSPSFALAATPSAVTLVQGVGTGASTISIVPQNAFAGQVALAVSGLPRGVTAFFSENPATSSSVVTFTASKSAKAGTATVTITGTSGSIKAATTIALTVNPLGNFTLAATPKALTIERGNSGTSTIAVTPKDMFDQSVNLSAIGMPKGVTVRFSPSSTTSTSTMTLAASPSAAAGKYAITVTGVYGTLSHEAFVTLTVTK